MKQDEVKLLIQYLQKHEFFKDLPSAILARPGQHQVILRCEVALEAESGGTQENAVVELLHLISGSIQMKTKGRVVEEAGKNAPLGDEVLRKELYATSAIVRTDALVLTISDAAFILSACFCEGIGTCGNAFHLSGLSADTPTLTCHMIQERKRCTDFDLVEEFV